MGEGHRAVTHHPGPGICVAPPFGLLPVWELMGFAALHPSYILVPIRPSQRSLDARC